MILSFKDPLRINIDLTLYLEHKFHSEKTFSVYIFSNIVKSVLKTTSVSRQFCK